MISSTICCLWMNNKAWCDTMHQWMYKILGYDLHHLKHLRKSLLWVWIIWCIMVSDAIFLFFHLLKNNIFGCRIFWMISHITATCMSLLKLEISEFFSRNEQTHLVTSIKWKASISTSEKLQFSFGKKK